MVDGTREGLGLGEIAAAPMGVAEPSIRAVGARSLRGRAIRASVWATTGLVGGHVLQLGSNLVLTRLLFPEAFGLMSLVFVFVQGMQLLSDFGIGLSVVQSRRGDDAKFLNTAWTLQIIRGLGIWICSLLIAWPVAAFYAEPQLKWLLPIVGLTAIISGFGSTARFTLNRHLVLGKLTVFDLAARCLSIAVMIGWAWLRPSIWALVAGAITGAAARMTLSHRLLPGQRNRLAWDRQVARSVFGFGKWIFLTSAVGFLAAHMDRLILGKLLSFEVLGIYTIAFMLSNVPQELVANLAHNVIFPSISRRTHLPRAMLRALILRYRLPFLCAIGIPVAVLVAFGDLAVTLLYDGRYHRASWMLSILALGLWPRMLMITIAPALLAIGQPRYIAFASMLRVALFCIGLPSAHYLYGVPGVVALVAVGSLPSYVVEGYGLWRHSLLALRQDLTTTALWVGLIVLLLFIRTAIGLGIPFVPPRETAVANTIAWIARC